MSGLFGKVFAGCLLGLFVMTAWSQTPPEPPKATEEAKPQEPPAPTPPAGEPQPPAGEPKPPAGEIKPPMGDTPPPAAAKSQFPLKLEKDKPFFQKITSEVEQSIKVQGGADRVQRHEQTFFFKWLPKDHIAEADKWVVTQTIEGARMVIDIAGNQVKYDSTAAPEPGSLAQPSLADFFGKLVGHEFTVTFGKDMTVEKVDGREDFIKKVGGINPQMEAILKKMLTEEALRQMVNPTFGLNPPSQQPVGGTWDNTTTMNLGPLGMYEMTTKYTYKGKDQTQTNLERIDVATSLKYIAPTEQQDGLLFKIKGGTLTSLDPTPEMAAKNFILYDPAAGRVVKSSMVVKLKGTLNVSIGGTDTTIDLTQEQTTTTESQDATFIEPRK